MPIATNSRTRFKKLSYKASVIVHRGNLQQSAHNVDIEGIEENEAPNLGVDLSEVTEHHLQAALSSTQLAAEGDKVISAKPAYHIPTPESKQVLQTKEYARLYPPGTYQDPISYVRSSSTLEDAIKGPSYNLDEDDNEWLQRHNAAAQEAEVAAAQARKNHKASQQVPVTTTITEDELEMVLTVFEQYTNDKVPFAHLDPAKNLPSLDDLLGAFDPKSFLSAQALPELPTLPWETDDAAASSSSLKWSKLNPWHNLAALKPIASLVYPWWKERREDTSGKAIVPLLNFDESNDSDPYVCFRRREVKLTRKTRKTDVLHLEKLIRLKSEMDRATAMLEGLAQREKTKRASVAQDRAWFETVKDLQELKRSWGIVGPNSGQEDEEIISGERREEAGYGVAAVPRKKKRGEESTTVSLPSAAKLAAKKARTSVEPSAAANASANAANVTATPAAATTQSLGQAIMERASAVQAYIERECMRKAETDVGWEENSDTAYQPVPAPLNLRSFRPVQADSSDTPSTNGLRAGRPPSFRRRMGRGGRVFLDRRLLAPSPVPASLADWPKHQSGVRRHEEREEQRPERTPLPSYLQQGRTAQQKADALSGPFAYASNLRPSLLNDTSASSNASSNRSFMPMGASADHSTDSESVASSTASSSSSSSAASSASTIPTEAEDMDETMRTTTKGGEHGTNERTDQHESQRHDDDSDSDSSDDEEDEAEVEERLRAFRERWRYDDESGRWAGLGLCGLGGMEDDQEAVLDDFDQRFMRYRIGLLEQEDLLKLSTDWTHIMQAQAALDCPPPTPQFQVIGPTMAGQAQAAAAAAARVNGGGDAQAQAQAQAHAQAQAQAHAAAQAQAAAQAHQFRKQQAAAIAAAVAAGNNPAAALGAPSVPSPLGAVPPTNQSSTGAVAARAAQTNVGGPLTTLQQQHQLHQAQVQLALQQQQQRNAQVQAAAAAARAKLMAAAAAGGQGQQGQQGGNNYNAMANAAAAAAAQLNHAGGQASSPPQQQRFPANGAGTRPSSSPVPPQGSSPMMGHAQQPSRSPSIGGVSGPHANGQQQQQQRMAWQQANGSNGQQQQQQQQPNLIHLQQQLVAMQAAQAQAQAQAAAAALAQNNNGGGQQANGQNGVQANAGAGNGNGPSPAQLMAMKAALAQSMSQNGGNAAMQLKLPPGRVAQAQQQHQSGGGAAGGNGGQGS
ncbi:hypothetical protein BDZ90DRAFT_262981 [Jaminaea rosea]|uniref:Enhancer of polycomb-like protein n=1 Tax=Jaminaea rosea TaxID=1569628 RepID=A0A316ULG4_9BASI|nr:hypothetical protein BDZ90DRAFT_262981 [Jaminaea rosea]PWN24763.1 hypothetical protein BDZ90DRAFT_262981 [Jaminaea rosea]